MHPVHNALENDKEACVKSDNYIQALLNVACAADCGTRLCGGWLEHTVLNTPRGINSEMQGALRLTLPMVGHPVWVGQFELLRVSLQLSLFLVLYHLLH